LTALLAGCSSDDTTNVGGPVPAPSAPSLGTVSGTVFDGPVQGGNVSLFNIQPDGALGAFKATALSYPLPSPSPVLQVQMDGTGNTYAFNLANDPGPVAVQISGGNHTSAVTGQVNPLAANLNLRAAIPPPVGGSVHVTPFSTVACELALAQLRAGNQTQPTAAVQAANGQLASFLQLPDLLSTPPIDPARPASGHPTQDSINYGMLIAGLAQEAADLGFDPNSLVVALQEDVRDGLFDGLNNGQPIFVLTTQTSPANPSTLQPPNTAPLPATVLTQGLAAATSKYQDSPSNRSGRKASAQVLAQIAASNGRLAQVPLYQSPYTVNFTLPQSLLTYDFDGRASSAESGLPFASWFNLSSFGSDVANQQFGPLPTQYPQPSPALPPGTSLNQWRRERVVASAMKFLGHYYQHHHIPDWNPGFEPNWPWLSVGLGMNSAGIDCSDFTAWNYNYGLGLKLGPVNATFPQTAVPALQAGYTQATSWDGQTTFNVTTVLSTQNGVVPPLSTFNSTLQTGDLLYIDSQPGSGQISHVIMWLGNLAPPGPEGYPLILDSHDNTPPVLDSNGNIVPAGCRIRPLRDVGAPGNWYYQAFNRANRIIPTSP